MVLRDNHSPLQTSEALVFIRQYYILLFNTFLNKIHNSVISLNNSRNCFVMKFKSQSKLEGCERSNLIFLCGNQVLQLSGINRSILNLLLWEKKILLTKRHNAIEISGMRFQITICKTVNRGELPGTETLRCILILNILLESKSH